jgi:hypothetical protein
MEIVWSAARLQAESLSWVSGSDGELVGHPGGGDFYALRSIEVRLKGSRARFYNIFVKGRVTGGGGPIVEAKGGEVLQAMGTEFSARPASASGSGGFNLQTAQTYPASYIEQLAVEVKRKPLVAGR